MRDISFFNRCHKPGGLCLYHSPDGMFYHRRINSPAWTALNGEQYIAIESPFDVVLLSTVHPVRAYNRFGIPVIDFKLLAV